MARSRPGSSYTTTQCNRIRTRMDAAHVSNRKGSVQKTVQSLANSLNRTPQAITAKYSRMTKRW